MLPIKLKAIWNMVHVMTKTAYHRQKYRSPSRGKGNAATATVATSETKAETVNQPAAENSVAETTAIDSAATVALSDNETSVQDYWTPVIKELNSYGETTSQQDRSWIYIFFAGFIGGLLALFTPCVWPIIPMTVSFFLKRSKDKKERYP